MKKFLSLVLSVIIVLSLSAPAFAAEDASTLTDAEIYNRIIALKSKYPEGMRWAENDPASYYEHSLYDPYQRSGSALACDACQGFAMMVLDNVFPGVMPFEYEWDSNLFSYDAIRVGDMINFQHAAIVIAKDETGVTICEGNYGGTVHWGRRISKDKLMTDNYLSAITTCRPWKVTGTTSRILVNGVEKQMEGYCLDGHNYFKIRDLAMALSGTSANFDVSYDSLHKEIIVETGKDYTIVGGECKQPKESAVAYGNNTCIQYLYCALPVHPIVVDGNNYFMLRSVAELLGTFDVGWDGATNTIIINTK